MGVFLRIDKEGASPKEKEIDDDVSRDDWQTVCQEKEEVDLPALNSA